MVFKEVENSSESVLTDTQTVMMSRSLAEDVLEWVQKGWMPLEEQEVMKCVLHPMEFERIVEMSRKKREKEREKAMKEMKGAMEMDAEKSTRSLEGVEQVNENGESGMNDGMNDGMNQQLNDGMNQQLNDGMNQQLNDGMNHEMNQQLNCEMTHEMNYEAMNQSHNSHRESFHNSNREAIQHESLFHSSQRSSKSTTNSSLVSGAASMASVPAISIAVKRPGPVKSEEDVEDFFNALDSGSQMAVESQYVHQSKRTMERREESELHKLDALDAKEEMDLMDEVDRMEMEIEEEKLRESQVSQSKTDSTSQFSSQTHVETHTPFSQPSLKPVADFPSASTSVNQNDTNTHNNMNDNITLTKKKPTFASPSPSSTEQRPFASAPRESSQSSEAGRSSNTIKLLDMEGSPESPILQPKGKRFIKHAVKKSSHVISLTPYHQFSSVCHKHFHKTTTQLFFLSYQKLPPKNGENDIGVDLRYGSSYASNGLRE